MLRRPAADLRSRSALRWVRLEGARAVGTLLPRDSRTVALRLYTWHFYITCAPWIWVLVSVKTEVLWNLSIRPSKKKLFKTADRNLPFRFKQISTRKCSRITDLSTKCYTARNLSRNVNREKKKSCSHSLGSVYVGVLSRSEITPNNCSWKKHLHAICKTEGCICNVRPPFCQYRIQSTNRYCSNSVCETHTTFCLVTLIVASSVNFKGRFTSSFRGHAPNPLTDVFQT